MAQPGPVPMPTALKQMLGEKDINRQEPRPTEVKATPPRSLTDKAARKLYKTLATELVKFGLLTKIDVQDLADACQLWANADTLARGAYADMFLS